MRSALPAPEGGTLAVFHLAEASGPSISLRDDLRWLAGSGPLTVVVPGRGRVLDQYSAFADVRVLDYSPTLLPVGPIDLIRSGRALVRDVRRFRELIRVRRPSRMIVVTTSLPAVLLAARAERVPAIVYAAEVVPVRPGVVRRLGGTLVRRLTRWSAAGIVSCSDAVAAQFAGPGAPPMATAYPPVGDDCADGDGPGLRARLGIAAEAPCIAAVGAISRGRGQDTLVRALPRLRERFPELRVLLAGAPHPRPVDLAYRDRVQALAGALGVTDAIAFAGFVEPVADLYAAADVVVNPARWESFGRVAAEALVAGTPVVATRVGGVPEVLRDGVDALLVAPDDPDTLAAAVVRLLDDRELAERLVAAGAERVRREFSARSAHERFAEVVGVASGAPG